MVKRQQAQADKAYEIQTNVMQQQVTAEAVKIQQVEKEQQVKVKAEAYQQYNQAAVVDKLFTNMPEIVKALASPLANVDRITVVSTGDGNSAGLNKITGDIAQMAAQVPALFEALSGMKMSDLLGKVRTLGDKTKRTDEQSPSEGDGKSKAAGAGK